MRRLSHLAVVVFGLLTVLASAASAQTVDEVIAKNLKAKGGVEKWKSIQTMRLTGKVAVQGMDLPMVGMAKRPNLARQDISVQDKKIVQAFDGTTVWAINPMMGSDTPQEMTGPQADMMKAEADLDGDLVDYKEKGSTVELVGEDTIDGTKVYHLKVTRKGGIVRHLYIDKETGLDLRSVTSLEMNGQPMNITSDFSNYQAVEGIMVPFSVKQSINGTPAAQVTVEKIEFNVPIEEGIFKMPVKQH